MFLEVNTIVHPHFSDEKLDVHSGWIIGRLVCDRLCSADKLKRCHYIMVKTMVSTMARAQWDELACVIASGLYVAHSMAPKSALFFQNLCLQFSPCCPYGVESNPDPWAMHSHSVFGLIWDEQIAKGAHWWIPNPDIEEVGDLGRKTQRKRRREEEEEGWLGMYVQARLIVS